MVVTYRANAAMLRAMKHFTRGRADTAFLKKVTKLEMRAFERVIDLVLARREEIRHPDPRLAVSFGLIMVVATLHDLIVSPVRIRDWKDLLPADDQALKRELTRAFLRYLDVDGSAGSSGGTETPRRARGRRS
jgi:hypothetical protein